MLGDLIVPVMLVCLVWQDLWYYFVHDAFVVDSPTDVFVVFLILHTSKVHEVYGSTAFPLLPQQVTSIIVKV